MVEEDPDVLMARFEALATAAPLVEALKWSPIDVYLLGGAVRDLMLGIEPRELDLVVEGRLGPVIELLGATSRHHERFGTAIVTLDGEQYDLAETRRESYERPGALPTVAAASLDQDLHRRDFTVNAIALAIAGPARGLLVALGSAIDDLKAGVLRVLHEDSFRDDPTRLIRLALYAARLGFEISPKTRALAEQAVSDGALGTVSGARIGAELRRLVSEADPVAAMQALRALGIDVALAPTFGLRDPELARRALALLPGDGDRAALTLAAAGLEVGHPQLVQLLDRLSFEARQRDTIVAAADAAHALAQRLQAARSPSQIAAAVGALGPEAVALAGALGPVEPARRWLGELRDVRLEIDGNDLLAAGVSPGPAIGAGLRAALGAKLDGRAPDREAQLAEALRGAADSG